MEDSKVFFSVVICSYNIEKYIERAIKSVLDQTYKNYELLVVDDSSIDDTSNKIKNYEKDGVRFYSTQVNTGTAAGARNIGIKEARGEYIVFLDGDDTLYDNDTLKKLRNTLGEEKVDILFCGFQDVGGFNKTYISNAENSTKANRIACDINFSVSSKCWNREFLNRNNLRFIEGRFYEDMDFSIRAVIKAEKLRYGDNLLFKYYRNREGSVMSTPSIKRASDMYRMMADVVDLYNITPKEYRKYLLSFIRNETDSLPMRINAIINALENNSGSPVLPKRNYELRGLCDENNNISSKTC